MNFDYVSTTFFNDGMNLGHSTIIMNRKGRVKTFEVIFNVDKNGELHFYYENDIDLDDDDREYFENWFKSEADWLLTSQV